MTIGLCFWILMLFWLVLGIWHTWPAPSEKPNYWPVGGNLLLFIVIFLLGVKVFGWPIQG